MAPSAADGSHREPAAAAAAAAALRMPLKQKMAVSFKSLLNGAKKLALSDPEPTPTDKASIAELFPKVDPAIDGDDCNHDCSSCVVRFPKNFKIDEEDVLYGFVKGWSTHVLVATGKSDWVRDVADEKGSVMQAIGNASSPSNGRLMLSASNIPTPNHSSDYSEPTTVLLLPAFTIIENVTPATVPTLITEIINNAPTNKDPLAPVTIPKSIEAPLPEGTPPTLRELTSRPCPHAALILLCSQKTRDARCGQSAPLLRKELERHLRTLGLYRDFDDERPGGVGIYFISHVGGHKYSANVMVYRRQDAFGLDAAERAKLKEGETLIPVKKNKKDAQKKPGESNGVGEDAGGQEEEGDFGAAQCIWLARVRPEDCEGIINYTVLQGKVIKPETQLRGGFDRGRRLLSW